MKEGPPSRTHERDQAARLRALVAQADREASPAPPPVDEPERRARPPQRRSVPLSALGRSDRPAAPTRLASPPRVRAPLREGWADPAAALRSANGAASLHNAFQRPHPTLLAVASGKGGVGKTSLCVNLAIALTRRGVRTVLLDGDVGLANADVLSGAAVQRTLTHAILGECRLREALTPAPGGFLLAAGCGPTPRAVRAPALQALLLQARQLGDCADAVLIDCGAGVGEAVLTLLSGADWRVLLATPEPASIADAYAVFKQLRSHADPALTKRTLLLINQAQDANDAAQASRRLTAAAKRFLDVAPAYLGWLPADPRVGDAARKRTPVLLRSRRAPFSRATGTLARRLIRDRIVRPAPQRRCGRVNLRWLRRLGGSPRAKSARGIPPRAVLLKPPA